MKRHPAPVCQEPLDGKARVSRRASFERALQDTPGGWHSRLSTDIYSTRIDLGATYTPGEALHCLSVTSERCVIASFQIAEKMGFKGEFRQWAQPPPDQRLIGLHTRNLQRWIEETPYRAPERRVVPDLNYRRYASPGL